MNVLEQRIWLGFITILLCGVLVKITHNPFFTFIALIFIVFTAIGFSVSIYAILEKLLP